RDSKKMESHTRHRKKHDSYSQNGAVRYPKGVLIESILRKKTGEPRMDSPEERKLSSLDSGSELEARSDLDNTRSEPSICSVGICIDPLGGNDTKRCRVLQRNRRIIEVDVVKGIEHVN